MPHGTVETPAFMPVGTAGTVKALSPSEIAATGTEMILANTFHLYLRPGHRLVEAQGGLHRFMNWRAPILTDSGGFQVFSLSKLRKITEEGVTFQSPYDGTKHLLTPELSVDVQEALGSDVAMAFDECPPHDAPRAYVEASMAMTTRWLDRCLGARKLPTATSLFGIVQGGRFSDLREAHIKDVTARDLDGYAIGGVAVGESQDEIRRIVAHVAPRLPSDRPRYLMGVGYPDDLVEAVAEGVDLFDCVIPTRNARNGRVFTATGYYAIKLAQNREDPRPLDEACECSTCREFSRAYVRHLWMAKELLVYRLLTIHNLWFYQAHMRKIRDAIVNGTFGEMASRVRQKRATARPICDVAGA